MPTTSVGTAPTFPVTLRLRIIWCYPNLDVPCEHQDKTQP